MNWIDELKNFFYNDEGKLRNVVYAIGALIVIVSAVVAVVWRIADTRKEPSATAQPTTTQAEPSPEPVQAESFQFNPVTDSIFDIISLQPENPSLNHTRGEGYLEQEKYEDALKFFELAAKEYDPNSVECAHTLATMGRTYYCLEKDEQALVFLLEAQAINDNLPEANQRLAAYIYYYFAEIYLDMKNLDEAQKWYFRSLECVKTELGKVPPELNTIHVIIGAIYLAQVNFSDGLTQFREAYSVSQTDDPFAEWLKSALETLFPEQDTYFGVVYQQFAAMYGGQENYDECEAFLLGALEFFEVKLDENRPVIVQCRIALGALYYIEEKNDEGEAQFQEAYRISQAEQPYDEWLDSQLEKYVTPPQ